MDAKDMKKYLAGLGIAGLLAGGSVIAADKPAVGDDKSKSTPKSSETTTAKKSKKKPAPAKSG